MEEDLLAKDKKKKEEEAKELRSRLYQKHHQNTPIVKVLAISLFLSKFAATRLAIAGVVVLVDSIFLSYEDTRGARRG